MADMDSPRLSGSPPLSLPSSPSSPLLFTLAATGPVLPHEDVAPNLLADQASHLSLSAPSAAVACAASAGGDSYPHSYRTRTRARCSTSPAPSYARRRACSACSERTASESDAHGSGHSIPKQASALPATSASPISHSNMTDPSALPGASTRPSGAPCAWPYEPSSPPPPPPPPTTTVSHEPAREARDVRCDGVATGEARHRLQLAGSGDVERNVPGPAASLAAFPAPWPQGFGCADPAWVASTRAESNVFPVAMTLADLPNEVLLHVLGYLDVCDLLAMSRVSSQSVMPCPPALSAVLPRLPFRSTSRSHVA